MSRPRRKDVEIERTRRHIMDAAVQVFARKGYAEATMQDIAAEAEYSAPSLYSYFKGKQDILEALLVLLREQSSAMFEVELPEGLTLEQKLILLLRPLAAWVDHKRAAFAFLSRREGLSLMPDTDELQVPRAVGLFSKWFERNTTAEELGGHSPTTAAWLMWGVSHAFFCRWVAMRDPAAPTPSTERSIGFFLAALRAPVRED
ncbi:MAG: TetR/AcrR family transcriptional regulator [Myxococcales bacterium]|nr:TetR/AcrR family transcriptional regulator [Myxococcales bacterium]